MAWKFRDVAWYVFAACTILAAITAIVPGWSTLACWLRKDAAPAWVQAFGSIGAILAAIYVVHLQHAKQAAIALERGNAETRRLVELFASIAKQVAISCKTLSVEREWENPTETLESRQIHQSDMEPLMRAWAALPMAALPNVDVLNLVLRLQHHMTEFMSLVKSDVVIEGPPGRLVVRLGQDDRDDAAILESYALDTYSSLDRAAKAPDFDPGL